MTLDRIKLSAQTVRENIAILEEVQEPDDAGYYLQLEHENFVLECIEKQIPKKPMTQFEKLKQMNTDEAATFISALADSCKDVARYGNQTAPYLVKLLLESEVEEE